MPQVLQGRAHMRAQTRLQGHTVLHFPTLCAEDLLAPIITARILVDIRNKAMDILIIKNDKHLTDTLKQASGNCSRGGAVE